MKKFKVFYIIIVILVFIMGFSGGFKEGKLLYSYNDYLDYGIVDGYSGSVYLYYINLLIIVVLFVITLIITIINFDKTKLVAFIVISIFLLFIPIGAHKYSGGFAGGIYEKPIYILNSYLLKK